MFRLPQGIPRLTDYERLRRSDDFADMQRFSAAFLATHIDQLRRYQQRWVSDPLSQWSRTWEYPFVFEQLEQFASGRSPISVLDAGSGITFFPFFIEERLQANLRCVDSDSQLIEPFSAIVAQASSRVTFQPGNIQALDMADATLDAVVCISVLEHTNRYREITAEFLRVLKPGGLLVLTFDISPSGSADIAPEEAVGLVKAVMAVTDPVGPPCADLEAIDQAIGDLGGSLTTTWARIHRPDALPWRFPRLSALKATIPHGRPRTFIDLTCCCFSRTKPVSRT